ncbi:MAG: hypothetical protein HYR67_08700 [Bacteroidetes bacterium]|nr:hypothetical protein [Bacteroidota bacterium]
MKKNYLLFLIAIFAVVISCTDKSLDPLQFDKVKKGTILALRGAALDAVYNNGAPITVAAPGAATGNETFDFDAEYLASDINSLASVDIYVLKGSGANISKVLLTNVPFSQFKNDGTYPRPWVSISLKFVDIVAKLGLDNTFTNGKLPQATVDALVKGDYKFGVNIQCDLNLVDGTKVLASDIVSQGLFGSNQFYPAMRLNYPMIGYCAFDPSTWPGTYVSVETPGSTEDNVLTRDPDQVNFPNRMHLDNFWGDGVDAYFDMIPSTNPFDQNIVIPAQTTADPGDLTGTGTYDQCLGTITLKCKYVAFGGTYNFVYSLSLK